MKYAVYSLVVSIAESGVGVLGFGILSYLLFGAGAKWRRITPRYTGRGLYPQEYRIWASCLYRSNDPLGSINAESWDRKRSSHGSHGHILLVATSYPMIIGFYHHRELWISVDYESRVQRVEIYMERQWGYFGIWNGPRPSLGTNAKSPRRATKNAWSHSMVWIMGISTVTATSIIIGPYILGRDPSSGRVKGNL